MTPAKKSKSKKDINLKHKVFNQKIGWYPNKFIFSTDAKLYTVEEILNQIQFGTAFEENSDFFNSEIKSR